MFEKATRLKLRFQYKGLWSVEDLWDLTLKQLDAIYKDLNAEFKAQEGESLLEIQTDISSTLELKMEIVKHIVGVLLQEKQDRVDAVEKQLKKKKLLAVVAEKQDQVYKDMPLEDLQKIIDGL